MLNIIWNRLILSIDDIQAGTSAPGERRSLHGIIAKVLNCILKVSEFKLQLLPYIHF